jgi:UPF0755 protein
MNNKALIFIGLSVVLSMVVFTGYQYVFEENILVGKEDQRVCIPEGMKFDELLKNLRDEEIVHEPLSFAFLSKIMKYQKNIKPGCYLLKKGMSNVEAIRLLRSGNQLEEKLTFSNARFIEDLAGDLARPSVADSAKLLTMLKDPKIAAKYGFKPETFIAMFIPNTYHVYWSATETQILDRMKLEFDNFWTKERLAKAKELNMTPIEITTMASIVLNESLSRTEQPKVAGLYLNRYKSGMKLQADPTVKFALGDFSIKRILYEHLEVDSPYNTYKYVGLPPGPISMSTPSAIDAVLNYEKHDYLFMCSIGDGSEIHNFAKDYEQHKKYIEIYNKNLIERGKR